jgi:hypothetical protein
MRAGPVAALTFLPLLLGGCAQKADQASTGGCTISPDPGSVERLGRFNDEVTTNGCGLFVGSGPDSAEYIPPYPAVRVTVPPQHGVAEVRKTVLGVTLEYRPEAGFAGADRFTIGVEPSDIHLVVAVQVTPPTPPPTPTP